MKTTRAKFFVHSITMSKHWDNKSKGILGTVEMMPVTDGSSENREFFAATPNGSIKLGMVYEDALRQFEVGREFYVDFTPAGDAQ